MKKKPLFITIIVAGAVIGIAAVILFMKDTKVTPAKGKKVEPEAEPETEPEPEPETITE